MLQTIGEMLIPLKKGFCDFCFGLSCYLGWFFLRIFPWNKQEFVDVLGERKNNNSDDFSKFEPFLANRGNNFIFEVVNLRNFGEQ